MRYVQGERISLRNLEIISGVDIQQLSRRSKAEKWPEQRSQYESKLSTLLDEKVAEEVSTKISVELAALALENFNDYKATIKLARRFFDAWNKHLDQIPNEDAVRDTITNEINPVQVQKYASVIDMAIKGLRVAAGLQYEDINTAIAKVTDAGYVVNESDESTSTSKN